MSICLHIAPCDGLPSRPWRPSLQAHWIVRTVENKPGFEPTCSTYERINHGMKVWDGRSGAWVDASPNLVSTLTKRAFTGFVAPETNYLKSLQDRQTEFLHYTKLALLRKRFNKPIPPAPILQEAPALETPARLEVPALIALKEGCGNLLLWRYGDQSFGLHAIAIGEVDFWLSRTQLPFIWHKSRDELPIW